MRRLKGGDRESSFGCFDANGKGQPFSKAAVLTRTPLEGLNRGHVFWRLQFSQIKEVRIRFLSVSSLVQMFPSNIVFIPTLGV